jgi:hypothetical protein
VHRFPNSLRPSVRFLLFIFPLVFQFVAAEGIASDKPSDETIRSQIPGAWISEETLDGRPTKLIIEYRSDGSFGASARVAEGRYSVKLVITGSWRVHNGILISHTEATGTPPRDTVHEVIAITESLLVLRDRDGLVAVKRRAPAKKQ